MNSLTVEHLSKCYRISRRKDVSARRSTWFGLRGPGLPPAAVKEVWALHDVSFTVEPGTILGVIGPNGAGKTTLLKTVGRITLPTGGRVKGRGRVVPLLAIGSGFDPDISGRENVFLNAAMYGIPRKDVVGRLDKIAEFAELGDFLDVPVRLYSSGMYLRLAFSVAVNMEPDILLADEVLAVGDLAFQERCLQRVEEVGRGGMTVLFVSHDMAAITRLCQRVLWLDRGRVVEDGDAQEIVGRYQTSAWTQVGDQSRKRPGGTHANALGEILSVRLVSEHGAEVGAARISEPLLVEIAFHARQGGLQARAAFDIYTRGMHAFRSVQPVEFQIAAPGVYVAHASIPAHLLAETIYSLNISVTFAKEGVDHSVVLYNALSFQAYDTDERTSARGTWAGRLTGVVTPRLEWKVSAAQAAVEAR